MQCPKCKSDELDLQGVCPVCGHQEDSPKPSTPAGDSEAVPEWRQELARRLREIKSHRNEAAARATPAPATPEQASPQDSAPVDAPEDSKPSMPEESAQAAAPEDPAETADPEPPEIKAPPLSTVARNQRRETARESRVEQEAEPAPPVPAVPTPSIPPPRDRHIEIRQSSLLASEDEDPEPEPEIDPTAPSARERPGSGRSDSREIEDLIDARVEKSAPRPAPELSISAYRKLGSSDVDRTILISRTLSGMIDLLIVVVIGSVFILVTDLVAEIRVFDSSSFVNFTILLIAIYLLYSIFFLWTSNQTLGQMLTDLRVFSDLERKPALGVIVIRTVFLVLGLLCLGAGLLWGLFDPLARCLHDRISHTYVDRI